MWFACCGYECSVRGSDSGQETALRPKVSHTCARSTYFKLWSARHKWLTSTGAEPGRANGSPLTAFIMCTATIHTTHAQAGGRARAGRPRPHSRSSTRQDTDARVGLASACALLTSIAAAFVIEPLGVIDKSTRKGRAPELLRANTPSTLTPAYMFETVSLGAVQSGEISS